MLVTFNHYYIHQNLSTLTLTYYFNKNASPGIFGGDLFFKWSSPACRQDANRQYTIFNIFGIKNDYWYIEFMNSTGFWLLFTSNLVMQIQLYDKTSQDPCVQNHEDLKSEREKGLLQPRTYSQKGMTQRLGLTGYRDAYFQPDKAVCVRLMQFQKLKGRGRIEWPNALQA